MPGPRINDHQVRIFMKERNKGRTQATAAARAGFSERTARNLHKQKKKRTWRTKPDPFEEVWQKELVPLLEGSPTLQARTLLEDLQRRHPDSNSRCDTTR